MEDAAGGKTGMATMTDAVKSQYPEAYGRGAGSPGGVKPDFTRCCVSVRDSGGWSHGRQCTRKRGFGPHGEYCKQHDPAAEAARRAAKDQKYNEKYNRDRIGWHGRTFFEALQQIAAGHNDARGLAQSIIDEFKKGERR